MSRQLVAAALIAAWCSAMPVLAQEPVTAFVNVSVIPMDRERVLTEQTVLVQRDRIIALGRVDQVKLPAGAVRIDGQGKYLIPGLADMHVHLGNDQNPGSVTDDIDADAMVKQYEWALLAFLANGVTTVRNLSGGPWHVRLREQIAKGAVLGPRFYTAGPSIAQHYVASAISDSVSMPEAVAKLVAEHRTIGYDFLKLWGEVAGVDREVFDTLVVLAKQANVRIVGHTPLRDVGLDRMLESHAASIEHLSAYLPGLLSSLPDSVKGKNLESQLDRYELDASKIPALAAATQRAGVWNCPTQFMYKFVFERYYKDKAEKYLALRSQVIKALQDAGAGLLLGTDATDYNFMNWGVVPGVSIYEELQSLVEAGLTPYQALATGTRNPAAFLGTLDSTGTVTRDKRADLVLLTGNPLEDIRNTKQPVGVMVGGRWFLRAALDARVAEMQATGAASP